MTLSIVKRIFVRFDTLSSFLQALCTMAKGNKPQPKEARGFNWCLSFFVLIVAIVAYFTGFFDFGIENYEEFHHERVKNFYGQILVDFHEYHGGYLTFGKCFTIKKKI